jgi:hypothetical protein
MAFEREDEDIECRIIESYGIFSQGIKFWNKELNLVSWNGRPARLDIRSWQRDHAKCGKGIALSREEAEELVKLLSTILRDKPKPRPRAKPGPEKETMRASQKPSNKSGNSKKLLVPESLRPFYEELKLAFGAGPAECKSARNALLKKYHPDINAHDTTAEIAGATRKTVKIKEAYEKITAWWSRP